MKRKREPEQEIDFELIDGVMRTVLRPKWEVPHTFHTSKRFMDYLHGDVVDGEAEVACLYEYARESQTMWDAARKRDEFIATGMDAGHAAGAAWAESNLENYGSVLPATAVFLDCEAFPKQDWNALSSDQRHQIARFFPTTKVQPLRMLDLVSLDSNGVLDKFKEIAAQAKPIIQELRPGDNPKPQKLVWPILQQHESIHHAIFTLDCRKTEAQLVNEFREWLALPGNQKRLAQYKMPKVGTTGAPLDRLKDLAAWRLYREFNNDVDAANRFANDNRKLFTIQEIREKYKTKEQRQKFKPGSPRPFRDAKPKGKMPANEADLFGAEADAYKAKLSALEHLTLVMPLDFPPPPGPAKQAVFVKLRKLASKK